VSISSSCRQAGLDQAGADLLHDGDLQREAMGKCASEQTSTPRVDIN
jgi:hypothetical protein